MNRYRVSVFTNLHSPGVKRECHNFDNEVAARKFYDTLVITHTSRDSEVILSRLAPNGKTLRRTRNWETSS